MAYFAAPFLFMAGPEAADNHSVQALRQREQRPGKQVEFDRCAVLQKGSATVIKAFTGEDLLLVGLKDSSSAVFSVRGQFINEGTVAVLEMHRHWPWIRDTASMLGLALIGLLWLGPLVGAIGQRGTRAGA
jgi:hypothetical protein